MIALLLLMLIGFGLALMLFALNGIGGDSITRGIVAALLFAVGAVAAIFGLAVCAWAAMRALTGAGP